MALHGTRFILIEFGVGVAGCVLLGALSLVAGIRNLNRGVGWQLVLGLALLWIGLNYVPLFLHAVDLGRSGTARSEAASDLGNPAQVRRYGLLQLWILVPFAVGIFALLQRGTRR